MQKNRKSKRHSCSELFRKIQLKIYLRKYCTCNFTDREIGHLCFLANLKKLRQALLRNTQQHTAQTTKFSIKDFFSKCGQIRSFLRITLRSLKKYFMENIIFSAVIATSESYIFRYVQKRPSSKKSYCKFAFVQLLLK